MDPQQVVSNDCETQKDYIDDARLKKMMKETQPSFMERYGSCLVTFVLIAINVVVFGIEVVLNGFNPDISSLVLFDMGAMFAPAIQGQGDLTWQPFIALVCCWNIYLVGGTFCCFILLGVSPAMSFRILPIS